MTVVFFHHRFAIPDFLLYLCNGKGSTRVLPFLVPGPSPVRQLLKKIRFHLEVGCHPARMSF